MNGFSDVHAAFGAAGPPDRRRLGNPWERVAPGAGPVWIGTATSTRGVAILPAEAPGWRLWASGDVFSYRSELVDPLAGFAADLAVGRSDPALLDAHAVVFGWEEAPRRLHVWTDRMGTVHTYVGGHPGRVSVGTFLGAVAEGSSGELDWVGITGFCGFGFYPADRTMYDDVRILRPATWTVFDEHGSLVSDRRYWDWRYAPEVDRTDDDLLDEFHDIWTRTVRTQLGDHDVVVPISGGLDSRTVFATAVPPGTQASDPRVRAFTYGFSRTSPEILISQRVAAARGLHADEFVVEPYLLDRLDDVTDAVEGFQSLSYSRQAGVSGPLAAMGDRVVGGHWGDVWFDTAGGAAGGSHGSGLVEAAHGKFARPGRAWLLDHLCTPNLGGQDPDHVLRGLLSDELARLPDLGDADLTLKALKTEQWSFRWTLASIRAYQLGLPTLMPFYANEVVDFFLRVPTDRLSGRRLQTAYLRRHHPDLARITWQDTDMSLFERLWEPGAALARRAVRKAIRTARRQTVLERNWEVQYLMGDGPGRLRDLLLDPGSPAAKLAGEGPVKALLQQFLSRPEAGNGYTVDMLATIAAGIITPSLSP